MMNSTATSTNTTPIAYVGVIDARACITGDLPGSSLGIVVMA
jgi:hypothetical protein